MSKNKIKTDGVDTGLVGKYRKKETASASAATSLPSTVVRQPTAVRRAEFVSASSNKNACWSSFPNLPVVNSKTKLTPPQSPNKPRSKSVRMPKLPKKNITTRFYQFLGSHSNLGSSEKTVEVQKGVYTPLRPRSIGGSSDCSSNQSDLSRCDSLRDSNRSRVSHMNESITSSVPGTMAATPLMSYDSFDSPLEANLSPAQTQEFSNLRPISIALPHSTSSVSLTSGVRGNNSKVDLRYHSYAAPGGTEGAEERQRRDRLRGKAHRSQPLVPLDVATRILAEFHCGSKTSQSVLPSDPEYPEIAQELMSASPTRKSSVVTPDGKLSSEGDPHHVAKDSGVESLHTTRTARSLPTTPLNQNYTFVRQEESAASLPNFESGTPQDLAHQDSSAAYPSSSDLVYVPQHGRPSYVTDLNVQGAEGRLQPSLHDSPHIDLPTDLPPGWEVVKSSFYGTYFVNHNNRTAQYQPPHQHPHYSRPPSANRRSPRGDEEDLSREGSRKIPLRSFSHRGQDHRVVTSMSSLPRRTKSFREQEEEPGGDTMDIAHERQISTTMTYVPPSPYQIKEIPFWLREYIDAPLGAKEDKQHQWEVFSHEDLNGLDTMIKRLLKKGLEQIVKKYEYYRVTVQQELEERSLQRRAIMDDERSLQRRAIMDDERSLQRRAIMDDERSLQRRAIPNDERSLQRRAIMDDERSLQRGAIMDDERSLQRRAIPNDERSLQRRAIPNDERSLQRRAIMDDERSLQRGAIMDDEKSLQRRAIPNDERSLQRRAIMDDERSLQRRAMTNDERSLQRRAIMDDERSLQRRASDEPVVEMSYQAPPLPVPYNQPFPHYQPHPQGQEYMQATPSYLLEHYNGASFYHPSCHPPSYPNFCVVEPVTAITKTTVPAFCLEETYV